MFGFLPYLCWRRRCNCRKCSAWHRSSCSVGDLRSFAVSLMQEALQLRQVQRVAQHELLGLNCLVKMAVDGSSQGFNFTINPRSLLQTTKNPEIPRAAIFFPRFGYVPTFEELSNAPWMPNPGWLISSWEDATSARSRAVGMPLSNPCGPGLSSTPQTRRRRDRRGMTMLCDTAQCASWPLGLLNVLSWHCREAKDEEADRTIARPQMAWQNGRVKWMNRGP